MRTRGGRYPCKRMMHAYAGGSIALQTHDACDCRGVDTPANAWRMRLRGGSTPLQSHGACVREGVRYPRGLLPRGRWNRTQGNRQPSGLEPPRSGCERLRECSLNTPGSGVERLRGCSLNTPGVGGSDSGGVHRTPREWVGVTPGVFSEHPGSGSNPLPGAEGPCRDFFHDALRSNPARSLGLQRF